MRACGGAERRAACGPHGLARVDEGAADEATEELVRAGVLEDTRPLGFVPAIVRDAVAARLSAGVRESLHARAAELLARATPRLRLSRSTRSRPPPPTLRSPKPSS